MSADQELSPEEKLLKVIQEADEEAPVSFEADSATSATQPAPPRQAPPRAVPGKASGKKPAVSSSSVVAEPVSAGSAGDRAT
ncbi:MAG: hypothetical protein KKD63_16230, partial [Proteobacteria bacterium]|nr:hypothetical protein [Pseudomonadota bacterium]